MFKQCRYTIGGTSVCKSSTDFSCNHCVRFFCPLHLTLTCNSCDGIICYNCHNSSRCVGKGKFLWRRGLQKVYAARSVTPSSFHIIWSLNVAFSAGKRERLEFLNEIVLDLPVEDIFRILTERRSDDDEGEEEKTRYYTFLCDILGARLQSMPHEVLYKLLSQMYTNGDASLLCKVILKNFDPYRCLKMLEEDFRSQWKIDFVSSCLMEKDGRLVKCLFEMQLLIPHVKDHLAWLLMANSVEALTVLFDL